MRVRQAKRTNIFNYHHKNSIESEHIYTSETLILRVHITHVQNKKNFFFLLFQYT